MKKKTISMSLAFLIIVGVFTGVFAGTSGAAETTPIAETASSVLVQKTSGSYKPAKVSLNRAVMKGKKVSLTWKKVPKATGYQVWRATKKKGTYKKVKVIKKASTVKYTDTGRTASKTYYYKVRAYRNVNGKTYYGPYSIIRTASKKRTALYAYAKFLKKMRQEAEDEAILNGREGESYDFGNPRFILAYIGTDNVPELLTVGRFSKYKYFKAYTYYNGKVKELKGDNCFYFKNKGNVFITGDSYKGYDHYTVYKIKTGKFVSLKKFEHSWPWHEESTGHTYYKSNGENVSKKTYVKELKRYNKKMNRSPYQYINTNMKSATVSNINKMIDSPAKFTLNKKFKAEKPKKVSVTSVSKDGKKATIKWKETYGTGYQIWRAASKNGTYKKVKTIKNSDTTKYTDTGLNSSKTYYYKVRAYVYYDRGLYCGRTFYGSFSSAKQSKKVTVSKKIKALKAYAKFLKSWREDYSEPKFQLAYIGTDNVPELLTGVGNAHVTGMNVYTYYNGKVKKVSDSYYGFGACGALEYMPKKNLIRDYYCGSGIGLHKFYIIKSGKAVLLKSFYGCGDAGALADRGWKVNNKDVSKATYNKELKRYSGYYVTASFDGTAFPAATTYIDDMVKHPSKYVKESDLKYYM